MATSLCQSPTWKPFSQVQRGGWRSFAHLPAAFLFVLASLCRCFLYKECLGKVCIEPKQKREAVAYHLSMGTAPWQWNPTETEDASLSLVTARHCLWLGPLWHKCTPMYLYIIKRFQSKTITQKMHWGRGWENKQEPDVWPVLSRTAEGSWAAQDESLQTLELHKVLGVPLPDAVTEHWASLSEWHCSLGMHKETLPDFQGSAHSLDCGKSWSIYTVEITERCTCMKHHTTTGGLLPLITLVCLRIT